MRIYKTKRNALKYGAKSYKGKPCRHGHDGTRYVNCNRCVECMTKRYDRLKLATPSWITPLENLWIKDMYVLAEVMSNATLIKHSVDHYYPLIGKTVCGLHTIANLCVITHAENMDKKNKHPDVFYEETNYKR